MFTGSPAHPLRRTSIAPSPRLATSVGLAVALAMAVAVLSLMSACGSRQNRAQRGEEPHSAGSPQLVGSPPERSRVEPSSAGSAGAGPQANPQRPTKPWLVIADEAEGIDYLEALVGTDDEHAKLPMIVAIHGLGYRPRMPEDPMFALGQPVRIVLPRAPTRWGQGFSWLSVRVGDNKPAALAQELKHAAARLAAFISAVAQRHPTRGKPIVLGFSQGGMLSWTLALHHPELSHAVFPLAGWLPDQAMPEAWKTARVYPRIRSMHGQSDKVIALKPTQAMVAQLRERGLAVELRTYPGVGHTMSAAMEHQLAAWLHAALDRELR